MRLRGQAFANSAMDAGHRMSSYVVGLDGAAEVYRPRVVMGGQVQPVAPRLDPNQAQDRIAVNPPVLGDTCG